MILALIKSLQGNWRELAKKIGIKTIALTGENGGILRDLADILINVPSSDTPRIQEPI